MTPEQLTSGADQTYWAALQEGHVQLPRCKGCNQWHWPAVWRCGDCGSWEHEWVDVRLEGSVYSWTRTAHPFAGTEAFTVPFVSVVVALDDAAGARLLGTIEGADADVRIGARVSGRIGEISAGGNSIPALFWSLNGKSAS
jgi:uncharacterized OB-fold protein